MDWNAGTHHSSKELIEKDVPDPSVGDEPFDFLQSHSNTLLSDPFGYSLERDRRQEKKRIRLTPSKSLSSPLQLSGSLITFCLPLLGTTKIMSETNTGGDSVFGLPGGPDRKLQM